MRSKVIEALPTKGNSVVVVVTASTGRDGRCAWREAEELAIRPGRRPHYLCPGASLSVSGRLGWLRQARRHVGLGFRFLVESEPRTCDFRLRRDW